MQPIFFYNLFDGTTFKVSSHFKQKVRRKKSSVANDTALSNETFFVNLHCNNSLYNMCSSFPVLLNWCLNSYVVLNSHLQHMCQSFWHVHPCKGKSYSIYSQPQHDNEKYDQQTGPAACGRNLALFTAPINIVNTVIFSPIKLWPRIMRQNFN